MLGKTENRQVWMDFPYPKEIFLALYFDRFCLEIKKKTILASARAWFIPKTKTFIRRTSSLINYQYHRPVWPEVKQTSTTRKLFIFPIV